MNGLSVRGAKVADNVDFNGSSIMGLTDDTTPWVD